MMFSFQPRPSFRALTAILILVCVACSSRKTRSYARVDAERLAKAVEEPGEWFTGGRDAAQTYYSPLSRINDRNVSTVGYAWHLDLNTTTGLEATPVVIDGVLYTSGPWGIVVAVDAATGALLWSFDPAVDKKIEDYVCCDVVNRGLAVYKGLVFVAALDGRLFALDAGTGAVRWSVNTIIDDKRAYTVTGAPYVADDVVVIGNSGAEFDARGYVSAYEINTGALRWRFFTVPGDPAKPFEHPEMQMAAQTWDANSLWHVGLGGTAWDGMAYDRDLNLLYVGTGNATPYARKLRSPSGGDNLFLASILAINPATGRLVWHYQTTPAENWDYTATQKMILADLMIRGDVRQVLMQAPKNGFFYVLDRRTGELLSAEPYVPVNWASHVDLKTGRPVETGQGEYWHEPKLIMPSPAGGHNWHPMSYNRKSGLVYIPTLELGAVFSIPPRAFAYRAKSSNSYTQFRMSTTEFWNQASPPAGLPSLEDLRRGQPDPTSRGVLKAWDPVRQTVAWRIDTSGPFTGSVPAIQNGGGVISTAGNLVIQGRSTGELYFYTADTGALLHVIDVGSSIIAAASTYMVKGEQYITVMAGMGGAGTRNFAEETAAAKYGNQGRIVSFKLGGGAVPKRPALKPAARFPQPPMPRPRDTTSVAEGSSLFARHCGVCHRNSGPGGVPDLRRMTADVHDQFQAIVRQGTRANRGMGSFGGLLSQSEVEMIRAYLIDLSWRAYEGQH